MALYMTQLQLLELDLQSYNHVALIVDLVLSFRFDLYDFTLFVASEKVAFRSLVK